MTYQPTDELISAYLDGELTAEEQARAEQLLADNSEARQLYDELRALRTSFEALPRHKAPEDLGRRVLRQAERTMLAGAPPAAGSDAPAPADAEKPWRPSDNVSLHFPRGWRPWVWSGLAVAAALLIMFVNSQNPQGPRQLADAGHERPRGESGNIGAAPGTSHDAQSGRGGDGLAKDGFAGETDGKFKKDSKPSYRDATDGLAKDGERESFGDRSSYELQNQSKSAGRVAGNGALPVDSSTTLQGKAKVNQPVDRDQVTNDALPMPAPAAVPAAAGLGQAAKGTGPTAGFRGNQLHAEGLAEDAAQMDSRGLGAARWGYTLGLNEEVRVVVVELTPGADQNAFYSLLGEQQIAWYDEPPRQLNVEFRRAEIESLKGDKKLVEQQVGSDKEAEAKLAFAATTASAPPEELDAVLLVASAEQVQTTLDQLQAHSEQFRVVADQPVTASRLLSEDREAADFAVIPAEIRAKGADKDAASAKLGAAAGNALADESAAEEQDAENGRAKEQSNEKKAVPMPRKRDLNQDQAQRKARSTKAEAAGEPPQAGKTIESAPEGPVTAGGGAGALLGSKSAMRHHAISPAGSAGGVDGGQGGGGATLGDNQQAATLGRATKMKIVLGDLPDVALRKAVEPAAAQPAPAPAAFSPATQSARKLADPGVAEQEPAADDAAKQVTDKPEAPAKGPKFKAPLGQPEPTSPKERTDLYYARAKEKGDALGLSDAIADGDAAPQPARVLFVLRVHKQPAAPDPAARKQPAQK